MTKISYFKSRLQRNPELSRSIEPDEVQRLERNQEEIISYNAWRDSRKRYEMQQWLREQFDILLRKPQSKSEAIDFIKKPIAKGFRIHPALSHFSDTHVLFFFDFLAQRLQEMGYISTIADKRRFNRPYWEETIQRHILKGNNRNYSFEEIKIHTLFKDKGLCYLQLEATIPNNDNPRSSHDFSDLVHALTQ